LFGGFQRGFVAHFGSHNRRSIKIDLLIDIRHHPIRHQTFDDVDGAGLDRLRQITDRNRGGKYDVICTTPIIAHKAPPEYLNFCPCPASDPGESFRLYAHNRSDNPAKRRVEGLAEHPPSFANHTVETNLSA
jgi:hypothetical protein